MDDICKKYKLETLKTLSDGYLCIGGLANSLDCKPEDVINAAIKIQLFMDDIKLKRVKEGRAFFQMRIGVHTGQIAGGIVGVRTIAADIWGETVQAASLIEKMALAGEIRISDATFHLIKTKFETVYTGQLKATSKDIGVYQITKFKTEYSRLSVSENVKALINKFDN
jgi:class 3 adenylate cyclase